MWVVNVTGRSPPRRVMEGVNLNSVFSRPPVIYDLVSGEVGPHTLSTERPTPD